MRHDRNLEGQKGVYQEVGRGRTGTLRHDTTQPVSHYPVTTRSTRTGSGSDTGTDGVRSGQGHHQTVPGDSAETRLSCFRNPPSINGDPFDDPDWQKGEDVGKVLGRVWFSGTGTRVGVRPIMVPGPPT